MHYADGARTAGIVSGAQLMDKKQPIVDTETANQILHKLPYAALLSDTADRVVWCNDALIRLLKSSPADIVAQTVAAVEKRYLKNIPDQSDLFFIMDKDSDEPKHWIKQCNIPVDNATLTLYEDVTEVTQLKTKLAKSQDQLNELSTVDPVSGLLNRRAMLQNLEPLVSRSRRYNNPLSIIAMELLNLDAIQQQHGEEAAIHVVKEVSFLLKDILRWADLVSRVEENRFLFILPETDKPSAIHLASKINSHISELSVAYGDKQLPVSACFGVAAWEKGNDSVLLLRHATQSLELAHQNGPGSIQDC